MLLGRPSNLSLQNPSHNLKGTDIVRSFMKNLFQRSLIVFAVVFAFSSTAVEANGQGALGAILKRMDMYNKSLQSLQADVTMVKFNSQLGIADTSVGSTSYLPKDTKRPMYARIDWTKPVQEQMAVQGD